VNSLVAQAERLCDLPHRGARRLEPPNGLVVGDTPAFRLALDLEEQITREQRITENRIIELHASILIDE
jgi:hypothetical protein